MERGYIGNDLFSFYEEAICSAVEIRELHKVETAMERGYIGNDLFSF